MSYIALGVGGSLTVDVWSDRECVGDLEEQGTFGWANIVGLHLDDHHYNDQRTILTVLTTGGPWRYVGVEPGDNFYDDLATAMTRLGIEIEEVK